MRILHGHRHAVRALAYTPGEPCLLVSSSDDRTVRLWDPASGEEQGVLTGHPDGQTALAFSADGTFMATGGRGGSLALWDFPARAVLQRRFSSRGPVAALAFDPAGSLVRIARRSPTFTDTSGLLSHLPVRTLTCPTLAYNWAGTLLAAGIAADGATFALAVPPNGVELYQPGGARQEPLVLPSHARVLCFCPAGRTLALGTGRFIELWEVDRRERLAVCAGHRNLIQALAFGPSGRWLLSTAGDRTVRCWDSATGKQLGCWDWEVGNFDALAVSPDGMTAAAGGEKGKVVVWDLEE